LRLRRSRRHRADPRGIWSWTGHIFSVKRTKSATKRTSRRVELRDSRGRALHSLFRRHRGPATTPPSRRRDLISTPLIRSASPRAGHFPKRTLFNVLHWGGWFGLGATFFPTQRLPEVCGRQYSNVLLWAVSGGTVTLAFRPRLAAGALGAPVAQVFGRSGAGTEHFWRPDMVRAQSMRSMLQASQA